MSDMNQTDTLYKDLLAAYTKFEKAEKILWQQFKELLLQEEQEGDSLRGIGIDYGEVLNKMIAKAAVLFPLASMFIALFNEEKGRCRIHAGSGIFAGCETEDVITNCVVADVYRTGLFQKREEYCQWEGRVADPLFDSVYFLAMAPLQNQGNVVGAMGLAFCERGQGLDESEIALFQRVADLTSVVLSNTGMVASLRAEIKERRQMEEYLRQSEERFHKIYEMSPSAIALISKDEYRYVYVNESLCKSTGYSKSELIGKTASEVKLWKELATRDAFLAKLSQQGEVNSLEACFLRKDSSEIYGVTSAWLASLNKEELIIAVTQDITELKNFQRQLKLSEEKFSQAFYLSPDAIIISKMDGTYVDVNEGFTRMSGFSKAEVVGKKVLDMGFLAESPAWQQMIESLKKEGEVRDKVVQFYSKNSQVIYGQLSARSLYFDGEPYCIIFIRDITEGRRREEMRQQQKKALLASKNKLLSAVELAKLGPWEYDPEERCFLFGDEFYAIFQTTVQREGSSMDVERYIETFIHPEDRQRVRSLIRKDISKKSLAVSNVVEHRIIRRDGEVRHVATKTTFLRAEDGSMIKAYGVLQDITERVEWEEERHKQAQMIQHIAYFDGLTGLPNRHHLNEWMYQELERARKGETTGIVLFIDLDELKMVNDAYGHSYGDEIIAAAGKRIVEIGGESMFVARIGGDEFVLVLPGRYEQSEIGEFAQRIIDALGQRQEVSGLHFHMTASVGVACYPADGDTVEEIIKNADNAMYAAKRDGKNCWRCYTQEMQEEAYGKMRLMNGLRYALERGELSLVYQPQIFTKTAKIAGFEALLRWESPEYGRVSPIQFIPLAEQSGLIYSIGQWVLEEACRFARRLTLAGLGGIPVAVNISSKQVIADDFIEIVHQALREASIKPHQLELEITESILMESIEEANCKLAELKALGVSLSLDDFGTGYSSLTYLRNLPVETVKIDKSFIDMVTTDAHGANIIGSIVDMAHTLRMKVVAEGVENEGQLSYLASIGCDRIQGYIFSPPVTEQAAVELLRKHF